jgi:hypothetical protein
LFGKRKKRRTPLFFLRLDNFFTISVCRVDSNTLDLLSHFSNHNHFLPLFSSFKMPRHFLQSPNESIPEEDEEDQEEEAEGNDVNMEEESSTMQCPSNLALLALNEWTTS